MVVWGWSLGSLSVGSQKNIEKVDEVQDKAAKLVLGLRASSCSQIARSETGLLGAEEIMRREAAYLVTRGRAREEGCDDDPLKAETESGARWAVPGREELARVGCGDDSFICARSVGPSSVDDIFGCMDKSMLIVIIDLKTATEEEIRQVHENFDIVIYTDYDSDGSLKNGFGGSAVVKFGRFHSEFPDIVDAFGGAGFRAVERADSFLAEQEALLKAAQKVLREASSGKRIAILTASQSNLSSIVSAGNRDVKEAQIKAALKEACERGIKVTLKHVKGHDGVLGNEIADRIAGEAMEEVRSEGGKRTVSKRVVRSITVSKGKERAKKKVGGGV